MLNMLSQPTYQPIEKDLDRLCDAEILGKKHKKQTNGLKKKNKVYGFLYKFYFFLITVPPMARGIYTCYYKLDGFNRSLFRLHVHTMPAWLLWGIVAISELVFFIYGVKHGAIDNTPKTPSALSKFLRKLLKSISPMSLYRDIRHNCISGNRSKAFARVIVLVNLVFYIWIAGGSAYAKFYQAFDYSFKDIAILIGILCALGALMSTLTFTLTVVTKAFPHFFKIRQIYENFMQKALGVFLVLLALLSAPLMIMMAKDSSTSLSVIIFSTLFSTFLVYVMSVYGLCRVKIDALNKEVSIRKIKSTIDKLENRFEQRLLNNLFVAIKGAHNVNVSGAKARDQSTIAHLKRLFNEIAGLKKQLQSINLNLNAQEIFEELMSISKKECHDVQKRVEVKKKLGLKGYIFNKKLPACVLFFISSSVAGIGTGFSCETFFGEHTHASSWVIWIIFIAAFSMRP